jgi:hypothetical protein
MLGDTGSEDFACPPVRVVRYCGFRLTSQSFVPSGLVKLAKHSRENGNNIPSQVKNSERSYTDDCLYGQVMLSASTHAGPLVDEAFHIQNN